MLAKYTMKRSSPMLNASLESVRHAKSAPDFSSSDSNMHIRSANPQDAPVIAALAIAFRNHLERATPSDTQFAASVARILASDDAEFCLAIDGDTTVGYVLQRYRYSMWAAGIEATIEDLFVAPAARKGGVGRKLIEYALQCAKARACTSVCLDTNENNLGSTRIYTQLGFNSVSKRWNGRQIFYRLNLQHAPA